TPVVDCAPTMIVYDDEAPASASNFGSLGSGLDLRRPTTQIMPASAVRAPSPINATSLKSNVRAGETSAGVAIALVPGAGAIVVCGCALAGGLAGTEAITGLNGTLGGLSFAAARAAARDAVSFAGSSSTSQVAATCANDAPESTFA